MPDPHPALADAEQIEHLAQALQDALKRNDRNHALALLARLRETARHCQGLVVNARQEPS